MICFENKLKEIHRIKEILSENEYQMTLSQNKFQQDLSVLQIQSFCVRKCTVYLRSLYIGSASLSFEINIKTVVKITIVPWSLA